MVFGMLMLLELWCSPSLGFGETNKQTTSWLVFVNWQNLLWLINIFMESCLVSTEQDLKHSLKMFYGAATTRSKSCLAGQFDASESNLVWIIMKRAKAKHSFSHWLTLIGKEVSMNGFVQLFLTIIQIIGLLEPICKAWNIFIYFV